MIRPPRLSRSLLGAVLPERDRDTILGDLEESYVRRADSHGRREARRWYRRQAALYVARLGPARLRGLLAAPLRHGSTSPLRFAARRLRRDPTFTLGVTVTLALGIGANATIFSVVDAVLFRPLPVADADRLAELYRGRSLPGVPAGVVPELRGRA